MDDPRREDWQKPDKVLNYLLVKKGDVVADVGAGTGYFTMLFAERVGREGMVYAVDVDESMTDHIIKRVKHNGVSNVKVMLVPPDNPMLLKESADLVFLCDTYIFIADRGQYLSRLKDGLKSDGRLAILSFNMKPEIPGAPPPRKRVPREVIIQEVESAGFILEAEYFFLPYQYFLIFGKK
jgi:ubiquinone/menaquinone biosynthesis C-methylase UbiE